MEDEKLSCISLMNGARPSIMPFFNIQCSHPSELNKLQVRYGFAKASVIEKQSKNLVPVYTTGIEKHRCLGMEETSANDFLPSRSGENAFIPQLVKCKS
jgi:hypothetical protein